MGTYVVAGGAVDAVDAVDAVGAVAPGVVVGGVVDVGGVVVEVTVEGMLVAVVVVMAGGRGAVGATGFARRGRELGATVVVVVVVVVVADVAALGWPTHS